MKPTLFVLLVSVIHLCSYAQTNFEFGHSFGANGTFCTTNKTENFAWGYSTPAYPSTWNDHYYLKFGNSKNGVVLSFENGALGINQKVKAYTDKYPFDDKTAENGKTNLSIQTYVGGSSRQNTNLLQFSLSYQHKWFTKNKFSISSLFGVGFLKTRVEDLKVNLSSGGILDSIGIFEHNFIVDQSSYLRNWNVMLILGADLRYDFSKRWSCYARINYNQGLYQVLRFHSYRSYTELSSGYNEYDEQWTFSRLSHYSLMIGGAFKFGFSKEK